MKKIKPLNFKLFRKKLSPAVFKFETTNEIKPLKNYFGQRRAELALNFGIGIKREGYNLFAMGPTGVGKRSLISQVLNRFAKKTPIPPDYCYIYNFDEPEKPIALPLPAGMGSKFQRDMKNFIDRLSATFISVFESTSYRRKMKTIANTYHIKRERIKKNLKIDKTPLLYKKQNIEEQRLQNKIVSNAVNPIINNLKRKYKKFPTIQAYLDDVKNDILTHIHDFIKQDEKTNVITFSLENPALTKYKVNLLVDNKNLKGAPIVFEEAPSYSNLVSRVEHTSQYGALVTNFTFIKSGSLHKANGGYLVIEARKLKKNIEAWEALKSALYSNQIEIKPIVDESNPIKPVSLEPMSIPLNIKVIITGDRNSYYTLTQHDPDFIELFKVPVDFDEEIIRNVKNINLFARLVATIVKRESLLAFHASAIAEVIDHSSRLASDSERLSTHFLDIEDIILEADYWAKFNKKKIVTANEVKLAIGGQIQRMDRARDLYYEDIRRDFIIIKTSGKALGQVNCLSVRRVGNFSYGHPTRVTARVRVGKGDLIDIQREIKLAGPLHSKAGLIISNFLASRFNANQPFSLTASIAFEQVYVWTDGDSASVGELCALLSALSDIPINQSLAITGSIDQHGIVQAIGGANEKIEGFYDVCKAKGLTGKQGIILPKVNYKNLMLREDIVRDAKHNKFKIYLVETIDEAIQLLTDTDPALIYPKIEKKLARFISNKKTQYLKRKRRKI